MKKLTRPDPPDPWGDGATACATRREWYVNLRKKDGTIHDRWNSINQVGGVSSVRRSLSKMTEGLCAWCGSRLSGSWHVEHWLHKDDFPRLAYDWSNLFPSCPCCNLRKQSSKSAPVDRDLVIDPILTTTHANERVWIKATELPKIDVRIIDPEFDDPAVHLEFVPEALTWRSRSGSKLGELTIDVLKFFQDRYEAANVQRMSESIRRVAEDRAKNPGSANVLAILAGTLPFPDLVDLLWSHWCAFYPASDGASAQAPSGSASHAPVQSQQDDFQRWFDQLSEMQTVSDNRPQPPSAPCFQAVQSVLEHIKFHEIEAIESLQFDADEGIVIVVGDPTDRCATFLCAADGAVGVLCSTRGGESEAWDLRPLASPSDALTDDFAKVRTFLKGER